MGFCTRCGDIVVGPRCKCGGSAVAPVVSWSAGDDNDKQDRWSKTYVTKSQPTTVNTTAPVQPLYTGGSTSPTKRFPRPLGTSNTGSIPPLSSRVSAHIASYTAPRSTSPTKHYTGLHRSELSEEHAEKGILPSPHGSELAKVYGSVLQPKETLDSFACAICATSFPPDATIYPDPSSTDASGAESSASRFLCRSCFVVHGGSKGDCPGCGRPVLILKSEGGFVENSGRVWHKKCFCCEGCEKNIGDHPMVDLLGRPCCADCFDTCLKRPAKTSNTYQEPSKDRASFGGIGGQRLDRTPRKDREREREGSPALDELEARLGILKSRENTPNHFDRYKSPGQDSPFTSPSKPSPHRNSTTRPLTDDDFDEPPRSRRSMDTTESTPERARRARRSHSRTRESLGSPSVGSSTPNKPPTEDAIEEMKRRFLSGNSSPATSPIKPNTTGSANSTPRRRRSRSRSRPRSSLADDTSQDNWTPTQSRGKDGQTQASSRPSLRTSVSTSSLRSALKSQKTGETEAYPETDIGAESDISGFALMPERTGESTLPLRIRRNQTGNSDYTTLGRDYTGATSAGYTSTGLLSDDDMHEGASVLKPQRTGDVALGYNFNLDVSHTGGTVRTHTTGNTTYGNGTSSRSSRDSDVTRAITAQTTGQGRYSSRYREPEISRQATGEPTPIRRQKTGEKYISSQTTGNGRLRAQTTGTRELISEPSGGRYRTSLSRMDTDELSDFAPPPSSRSTTDSISSIGSLGSMGSMSKIPRPSDSRPLVTGRFKTSSTSASSVTSSGYESSVSSMPDLGSDFSDTTSTRSSMPSTPASMSPPTRAIGKMSPSMTGDSQRISVARTRNTTPSTKSKSVSSIIGVTIPEHIPPDARCEGCRMPLFSTQFGGKFVTVPEEPTSTGALPKRYHTVCFKCKICGEVFEEKEGGHAVFVRVKEGSCHVRCAPPEKITLRKTPATSAAILSKIPLAPAATENTAAKLDTRSAYYTSSSRYERPPPSAPATTTSFPRFGGSAACPGCHKAVSPMERGVVPGPQSSRWHATCLVCGGQNARGRRKQDGKAGCGKKLDSAAKIDAEGGVWCRECLLLLPPSLRQQSPVRSPIVSMNTGGGPFARINPQATGTTLARQFTGLGGSDAGLLRQLTGGSVSPTRQLTSSPTKMHDGPRAGRQYPRPKSVIGTSSTGGEGRGMFLVRQLTGGKGTFSGNEYGL